MLSNSTRQLLLVIRNGRQEVHARTLTSVCKSGILAYKFVLYITCSYVLENDCIFLILLPQNETLGTPLANAQLIYMNFSQPKVVYVDSLRTKDFSRQNPAPLFVYEAP